MTALKNEPEFLVPLDSSEWGSTYIAMIDVIFKPLSPDRHQITGGEPWKYQASCMETHTGRDHE